MAEHGFYIFWSYAALALAVLAELLWLRRQRASTLKRLRVEYQNAGEQ